jgi:hypothetical protein
MALIFHLQSLGQHKEHRHHHQRHMMVPAMPKPHLVVRHSTLALAIFKTPLWGCKPKPPKIPSGHFGQHFWV